jgi:hypothetical protein
LPGGGGAGVAYILGSGRHLAGNRRGGIGDAVFNGGARPFAEKTVWVFIIGDIQVFVELQKAGFACKQNPLLYACC